MKRYKSVITLLAIAAGGVLWYAFRPERLFINQTVNEGLNVAASTRSEEQHVLASGSFHGVAHESSGMAAIYDVGGGKRVLRFTNFETSNGPDVQVYLVAAADATDSDTVKKAGFVSLGALKGNKGDQNYDVPADLDLNK